MITDRPITSFGGRYPRAFGKLLGHSECSKHSPWDGKQRSCFEQKVKNLPAD